MLRKWAWVVAALVLPCLPTASAAEVQLPDWDGSALAPEQATRPFTLLYIVDCADVATTAHQGGFNVTLNVSAAAGIVVLGPFTRISEGPCLGLETTVEFPLEVAVTREAAGLKPLPIEFTATAGSAAPASNESTIIAGFYPLLQAKIDDKIQTDPGDGAEYPIQITSFSNARTKVVFSLADDVPDEVEVLAPDPIILGSSGSEATGQMVLEVRSTSRFTGEQGITFLLTPHAADDETQSGQPVQVSVLYRGGGLLLGEDAPGLPSLVALATMGALAWATRRTSRVG